MPKTVTLILLAATLLPLPAQAAGDGDFLRGLQGAYSGQGVVRLRTNTSPIKVNCSFSATSSATALSLNGRCRGLVLVSRSVGADLKLSGSRYNGTYTGARSGPAALSGTRRGNSLRLAIRWARDLNGDRDATLVVDRTGPRGLTLTITDRDPASGKTVVTSNIVLLRK